MAELLYKTRNNNNNLQEKPKVFLHVILMILTNHLRIYVRIF